MQTKGVYGQNSILATSIRDTEAHASSVVKLEGRGQKSFFVYNGLNQAVAVQLQGCYKDGGTYINIGSATTVNASTNAVIGVKEVTELQNYIPFMKLTATCAVAPASGALTIVEASNT